MFVNCRSKLCLVKWKSFVLGGKCLGRYICYIVIYVYVFVFFLDKIYSIIVMWWVSKFKEKSLFVL